MQRKQATRPAGSVELAGGIACFLNYSMGRLIPLEFVQCFLESRQ